MLSALIRSGHSYPALHLAAQPVHKRSVHLGPLVLEIALLNVPAPTTDRDRTVLRRSEPSSRATLMGEQPNPWDLLQPQDVTSRHRGDHLSLLSHLIDPSVSQSSTLVLMRSAYRYQRY